MKPEFFSALEVMFNSRWVILLVLMMTISVHGWLWGGDKSNQQAQQLQMQQMLSMMQQNDGGGSYSYNDFYSY